MPDYGGSAKKRDKKSKAKGNEKSSSSSPSPSSSTTTTTVKANAELKNSSKNKQAHEKNSKEPNNNVNKSPKLNLNVGKSDNETAGDEIIESKVTGSGDIGVGESNAVDAAAAAAAVVAPDTAQAATEEFDFDDTDLQELNDNSETGVSNACNDEDEVNVGFVIETTCPPPPPPPPPPSLNHSNDNNEIKTAYTLNNNNNKKSNNKNESSAAICDKVDKKQCSNVLNAASNDQFTPEADENFNLPTNKRKATPPAALDLSQSADAVDNVAQEKYCPITPRRIVDVEEFEDDEVPNRVLRSSSSKALINSKMNNSSSGSATNVATKTTATADQATHNGDDDDNDDEDYDDEDEPDEELLVQFLGEANRIAEARLAARRQARAEAREIRMRELERQQKEQEQNADRVFDMHTASGIDPLSRSRLTAGLNSASPVGGLLNSARGSSMSSRRSSEDSLEEEGRSLRDIRHELRDVEERFRKAMIANAQLDNERASATYQIQLLKDKLEEMEELYSQLQREFKEKSRDCNALKRNLDKLSEELKLVQGQLSERDTLIAEQGLVIVTVENEDGSDAKRALVSCENAHLLGSVQGSLDVRLKKFSEEKQQLLAEVQQLQEQLENHKSQGKGRGNSLNGPTGGDEEYEAQREANKIITEYKYKLQKAEQEIANLQASLQRSETQVIRYKSTAEAAEKAEAELKIERRKLQRENREAMERLEELETSNNHLLKRLDKLKNAKSALLKDL